ATTPYTIESRKGPVQRAKIDFKVLEEAKIRVRKLVEKVGVDPDISIHGYPHFYYLDELPKGIDGKIGYDLTGDGIRHFVNYVFDSEVESLHSGEEQSTYLFADGELIDGVITCVSPDHFRFTTGVTKGNLAATWLRDLSDAYV